MTQNGTPTLLSGFILEEQTELTLDEICRACAVHDDMIMALVNEGVLIPEGGTPDHWRFTGVQLNRARVALRLQNDLDVNLAGAALALELLDEIDTLRSTLQRLQATGH